MKRDALPLSIVLRQMAAEWLVNNLSPGPIGRAYRRQRAWENALDATLTGLVVQGALERLQAAVDSAAGAEGLLEADKWRVGRHYSRSGEILEARRLIEDPLNDAKLFLFIELKITYCGDIRGVVHVKTWGERTLASTPVLDTRAKDLPPRDAYPWRVRARLKRALQGFVASKRFGEQTEAASASIRRAMDNALSP